MKLRRIFWCNIMVFMALLFGIGVSFVAQDTQSLEVQERQLKQKIARDAERIKVLEAEWSYLTRPQYLQNLFAQDQSWRPLYGQDLLAWSDYIAKARAAQLASNQAEISVDKSRVQ